MTDEKTPERKFIGLVDKPNELPENFAEFPKQLSEIKSEARREKGWLAWGIETPRDILIQHLRDIDSGKVNYTHLAIITLELCTEVKENPTNDLGYQVSAPDFYTAVGMVSRALTLMTKS